MKKIINYCSLLVLAVCLNACTEIVPLKDLGVKPKLVLHCFATPQYDTIPVYLTNSQPFFSSAQAVMEVTNAVVEISLDNQNWQQLQYNRKKKCYLWLQFQMPVVEGQTYYIRASAPDYDDISASCTVPFWREVNLQPEFQFTEHPKSDNYPFASFYISWDDYRGEENYYAGMRYYFNSWYYNEEDYYRDYFNHYVLWGDDGKTVLSDDGRDGQKMRLLVTEMYGDNMYRDDTERFFKDNPQYDTVYILFVQTDKHACLYENSVDAAGEMEFMIFTVEPSLIYTNVKNGYGVFGAMLFKPYMASFRNGTIEAGEYPTPSPFEAVLKSKNRSSRKK